jgi:anti-anti-sigma factor
LSLYNGERTQLASFCSVSIERDADTAFVTLEGEFGLSCEDNFRAEVASRMAAWCPSTVVVDLGDVTFIDSRGLRTLPEFDAGCRDDGLELTLVHADGQVQKVLRITGLDRLLPLERPRRAPQKESAL